MMPRGVADDRLTATHEGSPWVVSRAASPGAQELQQFLSRNELAHRWLDPDTDPLVSMLGAREKLARPLPLIVRGGGFFWPAFPLVGWGVGLSFQHFGEVIRGPITEEQVKRKLNPESAGSIDAPPPR